MGQILNLFDLLILDDTIFDDIVIDARIDKDLMIATILELSGAHLPVNTNTKWFKMFVNAWFKRNELTISSLIDTLYYEYNPIENYDRTEVRKLEIDKVGSSKTDSDFGSEVSTENKVSAFDTNTYQPSSFVDSDSVSDSTESTNTTDDEEHNENTHVHGNIGVTTTQQMISAERSIVQFNIYDWIAQEFDLHFFVGIY